MNTPVLTIEEYLRAKFLEEREQILLHKWLESEKVGHDIGFEKALLDWVIKHRNKWTEAWMNLHPPPQTAG